MNRIPVIENVEFKKGDLSRKEQSEYFIVSNT